MSTAFQEWRLEEISNFELEKWLFEHDTSENKSKEPPLECEIPEIHSSCEDIWMKENDYWLEECPLFEEIQPLDDLKNQFEQTNEDLIQNQGKFLNNQNAIAANFQAYISQPQDLFTSSIENTTLFFTDDNVVYIKTDPNGDFAFFPTENDTLCLREGLKANTSKAQNENGIEAVDAIVRNTAMKLDHWESDTSHSEASSDDMGTPEYSPNTTPEEETDDPEWNPKIFKPFPSRKTKTLKAVRTPGTKSQEDKRNRKKEQNKNAAVRYRKKKKAEIDKLLKEEEELEEKKGKLTERVSDIENEIKYLKGLMKDLFKAKGLIE